MNLGVYFGYMGAKPPGRIEPKIFLEEGIRDVITCFKFGEDRFRGLASAEGQILPFPIDFDGRPYNNHTLPCERVIWMNRLSDSEWMHPYSRPWPLIALKFDQTPRMSQAYFILKQT